MLPARQIAALIHTAAATGSRTSGKPCRRAYIVRSGPVSQSGDDPGATLRPALPSEGFGCGSTRGGGKEAGVTVEDTTVGASRPEDACRRRRLLYRLNHLTRPPVLFHCATEPPPPHFTSHLPHFRFAILAKVTFDVMAVCVCLFCGGRYDDMI